MWCCPSFCLPSWAVTSTKLYERNLPTIRDDFYIYIFHIFCHTCHLCFLHSLVKKTNCDLKESPSAEGAEDVLLTCMSLLVMWSSVSKRCDHSGVIFQIRLGWWFCFDVDFLFGFFWSLFCFLSNSKPIRITCINLRNLKKKKKKRELRSGWMWAEPVLSISARHTGAGVVLDWCCFTGHYRPAEELLPHRHRGCVSAPTQGCGTPHCRMWCPCSCHPIPAGPREGMCTHSGDRQGWLSDRGEV